MDIMIDIETLSTNSNALILCIGAIKFNTKGDISQTNIEELEKFYCLIDIEDSKKYSLDIAEKCIEWWNKQPQKEEIFKGYRFTQDGSLQSIGDGECTSTRGSESRLSLKECLLKFNKWIIFGNNSVNDIHIWSNGVAFDIPILENAYKKTCIEIPWKYWNVRDSRTIVKTLNVYPPNIYKNMAHNPIYDCYRQIITLQKAFKKIK
jgi:hypothetical protein